jgi:hypothetical protein
VKFAGSSQAAAVTARVARGGLTYATAKARPSHGSARLGLRGARRLSAGLYRVTISQDGRALARLFVRVVR